MIDKKFLNKYIVYAKKKWADEVEISLSKGLTDSVEVRNQKIESLKSATDYGLSVKVIQNHKLGFSYSTSIKDQDIKTTIDNAIKSAPFTGKDKYLGLPKKQTKTSKNLDLIDQNIIKLTGAQRLKLAQQIEKAAYAYDKRIKKTESVSFESGVTEDWIMNSQGIYTHSRSTYCGGSAEVIAQDKKNMEAGGAYRYAIHLKDFDPKVVGKKAAKNGVSMLGSKKIKTGKKTLLLENTVGVDLVSVIVPMLVAENVQKNKSLLKGKKGKIIASKIINLIDDPFLKRGLGSYLYDSEGVKATKKHLIQDGKLKTYFYDTYTAKKDGLKSTGNSSRGSIKVEQGIGPSNLFIEPGEKSEEELIKGIQDGMYIKSLMGLHMVDTISGNFSVGASGYLIKDGQLDHPINEVAIAGNLIDFIKSITEIGNNLLFLPADGSIGSPSLVIEDVIVSGE